jgi:hypothetical protein
VKIYVNVVVDDDDCNNIYEEIHFAVVVVFETWNENN